MSIVNMITLLSGYLMFQSSNCPGVMTYLETLQLVNISIKLRLHYNELAQRTATVWRYLTFGDIRCYTLKKSDECDH